MGEGGKIESLDEDGDLVVASAGKERLISCGNRQDKDGRELPFLATGHGMFLDRMS